MSVSTLDEAEALAVILENHPDYRILRRFVPDPARYVKAPPATLESVEVKTGIFLDVEATGLNIRTDRITQLALVPFTYDANGIIVDAGVGLSYYDDPGVPIPAEVVELTGITDEMVRGQKIDEAAVGELVSSAGIVIAHHASYDRPMVERRIPLFRDAFWGCSYKDIDWKKRFGCRTSKLGVVLSDSLAEFHEAHRAVDDCHVGVHVLGSARGDDGRTALAHLLESARKNTVRIWATDAPFTVKDSLKNHGYTWSNGDGGTRKCWWLDTLPSLLNDELHWLKENGKVHRPDLQRFGAKDRYSVRVM